MLGRASPPPPPPPPPPFSPPPTPESDGPPSAVALGTLPSSLSLSPGCGGFLLFLLLLPSPTISRQPLLAGGFASFAPVSERNVAPESSNGYPFGRRLSYYYYYYSLHLASPPPFSYSHLSPPTSHLPLLLSFLSVVILISLLPLLLTSPFILSSNMTRSHKQNARDHVGLANGTALPEEHLPRYFAKHGHIDADPKKVKKEGGGRGGWGAPRSSASEEAEELGYTMSNTRRRSNSSTAAAGATSFKSKFETNEIDPDFEDALHGPLPEDDEEELERASSAADSLSSTGESASVDGDKH